jgi:sirohydrochlorin cobaltochelatase
VRLVSRDLSATLSAWLARGGTRIGQIALRATAEGYELRHLEDEARADLALFTRWEDARPLAAADDAGAFRPLKTAPNLRHGWRLVLREVADVRRALDYFYPAMLGVAESHARGALTAVPLRETLSRQTGMYAITKTITDEQARTMIDRFCAGCLKQRLWEIADANPTSPHFPPQVLPLLCHEACNLLVAEARKVVKGK